MGETQLPEKTDDTDVVASLSRALVDFGRLPLGGGALAQAWMPVRTPNEQTPTLQTKGLPYSIVGPGDMLALFRCLSCKYSFSSNLNQMAMLGAPGRVFLSGEAETSDNVQQCNVSIYLRVRDAKACRVSSTVLLPIFAEQNRQRAVAVLEVTQFASTAASYQNVFEWARLHLENAGLYTPKQLETRTFEMQSHALSIRFFSSRDSALGCLFTDASTSSPAPVIRTEDSSVAQQASPAQQGSAAQQAPRGELAAVSQQPSQRKASEAPSSENRQSSEDLEEAGDGEESGKEEPAAASGAAVTTAAAPADSDSDPRVPAAAGAHAKAALTRADLERHFGLGLKEAAARLGVCNTTLKRACRRHGIMKWPRRELLRTAKMRKEAATRVGSQPAVEGPAEPQARQPVTAHAVALPGLGEFSSQAAHFALPARHSGGVLVGAGSSPHLPSLMQQEHFAANPIAIHHTGSSSHLSAAAVQPGPSHHQLRSVPLHTVGVTSSSSNIPRSTPMGELQWPGLASAAPPDAHSPAVSAAANAEVPGDGRLSFVDAIFSGYGGGPELSSVLGDWEQQLAAFRGGEDPHAMEVVTQAVARGPHETHHAGPPGKDLGDSFPDIPETWPMDHDGGPRSWGF